MNQCNHSHKSTQFMCHESLLLFDVPRFNHTKELHGMAAHISEWCRSLVTCCINDNHIHKSQPSQRKGC